MILSLALVPDRGQSIRQAYEEAWAETLRRRAMLPRAGSVVAAAEPPGPHDDTVIAGLRVLAIVLFGVSGLVGFHGAHALSAAYAVGAGFVAWLSCGMESDE